MPVRVIARFSGALAKGGNTAAECEDLIYATDHHVALSDGASEGSYSHVWARILVESFCQPSAGDWGVEQIRAWLAECRRRWHAWQQHMTTRELPWFTRHKLDIGSFATFVGIAFHPDDSGAWTVVACGDACLFVVRRDRLVFAFPIGASADFDNTPRLLETSDTRSVDRVQAMAGAAQPGDRVYLASDALAQWFLAEHERGGHPWSAFDGFSTQEDLDLFVSDRRLARAIRNDDIALVSLEIAAGNE